MKHTKIIALLALAVSSRAFSYGMGGIDTMNVQVANFSSQRIGLSFEGTTNTQAKGPQVIFGDIIITPRSLQNLKITYNANELIPMPNKGKTYKLKLIRLKPRQQFTPSNRAQPYSQKRFMSINNNSDILLVIPANPNTKALAIPKSNTQRINRILQQAARARLKKQLDADLGFNPFDEDVDLDYLDDIEKDLAL